MSGNGARVWSPQLDPPFELSRCHGVQGCSGSRSCSGAAHAWQCGLRLLRDCISHVTGNRPRCWCAKKQKIKLTILMIRIYLVYLYA